MRSSLFLTCVLASAAFACSSSSSSGTTDGSVTDTGSGGSDTGSGGGDTGSTGGDTGSTGGDTGSPGDTGGGDASDPTCVATTTKTDCYTCCTTAHTEAQKAFITALTTCGCKAGNCDTACGATFCATPQKNPDTTCNTCLGSIQTGACKGDMTTACGPGGPCFPWAQCIDTSSCNTKP